MIKSTYKINTVLAQASVSFVKTFTTCSTPTEIAKSRYKKMSEATKVKLLLNGSTKQLKAEDRVSGEKTEIE
jgi:hypothetical protein